MSARRPVLVTTRLFGCGTLDLETALADNGLTVVRSSSTHDLDELAGPLEDAVAWVAGVVP